MESWAVTGRARLHFGLKQVDSRIAGCFGGCGVSLKSPTTELISRPGGRLTIDAPEDIRVRISDAISRTVKRLRSEQPAITISSRSLLPRHSGFGSGTQLACCAATLAAAAVVSSMAIDKADLSAIRRRINGGQLDPASLWSMLASLEGTSPLTLLRECSGRGLRSSIGLTAFLGQGSGLLIDGGQTCAHESDRVRWHPLPTGWQLVVATVDTRGETVHGGRENQYFASDRWHNSLAKHRELGERLETFLDSAVTAVSRVDFEAFGASLRDYNRLSGGYYEVDVNDVRQQQIERALRRFVDLGLNYCGQSSWGPAVWAWLPPSTDWDARRVEIKTAMTADGLVTDVQRLPIL